MTKMSLTRPARSAAPADARLWRRGPAPVAAGPHDFGYFGPESVVWKVLSHPATILMTAPVTLLFQLPNKDIQAANFEHDPWVKASLAGRPTAKMLVTRVQRTVGVPVPIVLGDTPTADTVSTHLRNVHRRITGAMPGTDGGRYDANSPENVLFAHVTLFHAALRSYETLAYVDGHAPKRLSDEERDRFWLEVVPFAELMGAEPGTVPRSVAEVTAYYRSIENDYGLLPGSSESALPIILSSLRTQGRFEFGTTAGAVSVAASIVLAFAVVPPQVRRFFKIPAALDPFLAAALRASRPGFAPLTITAVGDRAARALIGPDGIELTRNARNLIGTSDRRHTAVPISRVKGARSATA